MATLQLNLEIFTNASSGSLIGILNNTNVLDSFTSTEKKFSDFYDDKKGENLMYKYVL